MPKERNKTVLQSFDLTYTQLDGRLDNTLRSVRENVAQISETGNSNAGICAHLALTLTLLHKVLLLAVICKYGARNNLLNCTSANTTPDTTIA